MAETCIGAGGVVVSGAEPPAAPAFVCDASTRDARRRRMELRRLRVVEDEVTPKRRRLESPETQRNDLADDGGGEGSGVSEEKEEAASKASAVVSKPIPATDHCLGHGTTSIRGRRRDMEDTVSVHPDLLRRGRRSEDKYNFYGVFDGHGCSHVATSCKDRMHELVAEEMGRCHLGSGAPPPEAAAEEWKRLMETSFSRMDVEAENPRSKGAPPSCRCELQTPKCTHVGSTAVVAVVGRDRIAVANCGDSRAVLCRNGEAVPLSIDHKPNRPDELRRIEELGGRVIYWEGARVLGVLAMSRAIGDGYLKPFVSSEPEVTVTERTDEDECLILASDGLWDVVSNEMACYIGRMCLSGSDGPGAVRRSDKACSDAAMLLTKLAMARDSADNISVVVVDLRKKKL